MLYKVQQLTRAAPGHQFGRSVETMHGLLLIGLSVIAASAVVVLCEERRIEEDYVPGNRAVVEHNGRMTGKARSRQTRRKMAEAKENQRQGAPTAEGEGHMLEMHELYVKFLKRCSRTGNITTIPRQLQWFMDANHLTEATVQTTCNRMHTERKEKNKGRQKRTYIRDWAGIWDKCIIPYKKDPSLPSAAASQLDVTHALYEKYTGFRFVEFHNNNSEYGLTHNNYLNYIDGSGCSSGVGNYRGDGQNIKPCGSERTQVHEIGHALGVMHEQKNPASMDYTTVLYKNIDPDGWSQYYRASFDNVYSRSRFYDISSVMHYESWGFNINYGYTMIAHDPDLDYLTAAVNFFYFFRDIQIFHSCFDEYPDCDPLPVCENGGYPTVLEGKCACRCPEGLDTATRCATATKNIPAPTQWPDGTFTLLKTTLGDCPTGFSEGRVSYTNTEWAWGGGSFHSPGYQDGYTWHHDVCTQTASSDAGYEWPKGEYCILRYGGTCPTGFDEGLMELYGNRPPTGGNTGTLPDGRHARLLQYRFCCREDGSYEESITLPNEQPFILYQSDYSGCQKVKGTIVYEEYYHLKGAEDYGTEISGALPYYNYYNPGKINTYYCVYEPTIEPDCGDVQHLEAGMSVTITSPSYPSDYPPGAQCMWHYQSPEGTTMQIDFGEFELPEVRGYCDGHVELKTYYPGMPGYQFCGSNNIRSRFTYENYLTVKLSGGTTGHKGFEATISVISDDDKCYRGNGQDESYSGAINYTQYFTPCLPWSEVQDCLFDQFDPRVVDIDLTNNYCRNVGAGQKPWCYVEKDDCRRENCDACTTGRCFDISDNCAMYVSQDPDYCTKNELSEAHRLCMETCGRCSSHTRMQSVNQITCDAPEDVSCISADPVKALYSVGDVVSYTCPYSNDVRTRTCTSEGLWTKLNFVCNACPSGWTVFEQRCFKWLGWDTLLTNSEAKDACAAMNGVIVKAKTNTTNHLLNVLSDMDPNDFASVWISMADPDYNDVWVWDDGEPVTGDLWADGQPGYYYGQCGISWGAEWWTNACDDTEVQTVCEFVISDIAVCADNLPNCMELLQDMPDMCSLHPDYAWQNCRHTCAVGECDFPVQCDDEGIDGTGAMVSGTSPISQGRHFEYKCDEGHYVTAGNLKRACLSSGQLTGVKPVCSPLEETRRLELFIDREIRERDDTDASKFFILPDSEAMAIPTDGNVTEWTFYARGRGSFALQIWRPTDREWTFELIGSNVLVSIEDGVKMKVQIPPNEQIQAKVGDLVGLVSFNSVIIPYDYCEQEYMPEHHGWCQSTDNFYTEDSVDVGNTYSFEAVSYRCRIYSIQVTLNPCNCI